MDQDGIPGALFFNLNKDSPFSFKCQVCGACCHNKAIQVAPYEALRLARRLGISTTEFYRTSTEEGGTILRNKPDGSCIFLTAGGCDVYPDRPLVCRLFPLGQISDEEGREKYAAMPLHPDCLGLFGEDETVGSYLDAQETGPYFHYDMLYTAVYKKMPARLKTAGYETSETGTCSDSGPRDVRSSPQNILSNWFDIDRTVALFCRQHGRKEPKSLEETVSLHLEAIEAWLQAF
ncbi:MAG: YkgJ family cysteine cluster protein [Candidatus Aminicenantes bacterium]|nr:YkgJ family cysteine cluster protein [Candidatus Aminicenantes bacterium]